MTSTSELQQRAIDFARTGDFGPQALATNLELARVAPANEGAWTRLSRCYMEGGQLDEATAALDAALQINPQNTIARSLMMEVTRRRIAAAGPVAPPARARARAPKAAPREKKPGRAIGGFGRAEFATLGQLAPDAAVEALGSRIEALLMALNERSFAAKAVDTRNRAGQSGARLFRRNTIHAGGPGYVRAFHQGGRWEPQLSVNFFSATPWGSDAVSAGIGFNFAPEGSDSDQERLLACFSQFQQLVAGAWKSFLTQWMAASGGFVQSGDRPPATDLMPGDALTGLSNCQDPREIGWLFCGRWLFADRAQDAEILADGKKLVAWTETSFTDLLPLWSSLYRG
jgi:tetratricopeptide (TPR) repeat protein